MKKLLVGMAVLAVATMSQAEIRVTWLASGGYYFNATPGVGILGDATGNSTVAYLVRDVDATIGSIAAGSYTVGNAFGTGGIIMDELTITEDGIANDGTQFDSYAWFNSVDHTESFTAGYVYAIIFQDNSIGNGDWYSYTDPIALLDRTGGDTAQQIEMNASGILGDAIDVDPGAGFGVGQVVPEPATALLFGIGAMGAWIVRRKNRIR